MNTKRDILVASHRSRLMEHQDYRDAYQSELDYIQSTSFDYATLDTVFRDLMTSAEATAKSDEPASASRVLYAKAAAYAYYGAR